MQTLPRKGGNTPAIQRHKEESWIESISQTDAELLLGEIRTEIQHASDKIHIRTCRIFRYVDQRPDS
jgi:hypothetical protein